MQEALFPDEAPANAALRPEAAAPPPVAPARRLTGVHPCAVDPGLAQLAAALPPRLHLGGSSWSYPGWEGLVWDRRYSESLLARKGLAAYAQHPLLRAVSIDRGFYKPLTASQYQAYAAQVPAHFRFTVKAPSLVTDALVRAEDGRGRLANEAFLDPELAVQEFIAPALEGLGAKIGALVFQLSPLPPERLARMDEQLRLLENMLAALPALRAAAPDGIVAVEVRDPEWLRPEFVEVLRAQGATYCLGLHPKLPAIEDQLWLLRALWPGPLVCRWNLHRVHGPYGYENAEKRYGEFDQVLDPDPATHAVLARVIRGTTGAGQNAFVTISNQAEGCAPRTIATLARAVVGG